jgi:glycosyltransferase involved in cell wall biosynthesis
MQKIGIVIPCYNEGARLDKSSFLSFARDNPAIYFIMVDDGSNDNTALLLEGLKNINPIQFATLSFKSNRGKAEAVRQGIKQAFNWQKFDFVGFLDADLSTPLMEIHTLLQPFRTHPALQIVFGSRKKTGGNTIHRNPLRHRIGRLYAGFVTAILRLDIYDTQCGAKIIRVELAKQIFEHPFIDRWLFDVELFCRAQQLYPGKPLPYKEIILQEWIEKGDSRIRFVDLLRLPLRTLRIFLKYR